MGLSGDQVVIVNRTERPLSFKADGRDYVLKPGKNYGLTNAHAKFAVAQNPMPGTEDYYSLQFESLVGVEDSDGRVIRDVEPIPQEVIDGLRDAERFDVRTMPEDAQKGRGKVAARYRPQAGRSAANANATAIGEA
jgi:hypothetical protein